MPSIHFDMLNKTQLFSLSYSLDIYAVIGSLKNCLWTHAVLDRSADRSHKFSCATIPYSTMHHFVTDQHDDVDVNEQNRVPSGYLIPRGGTWCHLTNQLYTLTSPFKSALVGCVDWNCCWYAEFISNQTLTISLPIYTTIQCYVRHCNRNNKLQSYIFWRAGSNTI